MGTFIAKQPNGLYCEFSTEINGIVGYNRKPEYFIEHIKEELGIDNSEVSNKTAWKLFDCMVCPFQYVLDRWRPIRNLKPARRLQLLEMGYDDIYHD